MLQLSLFARYYISTDHRCRYFRALWSLLRCARSYMIDLPTSVGGRKTEGRTPDACPDPCCHASTRCDCVLLLARGDMVMMYLRDPTMLASSRVRTERSRTGQARPATVGKDAVETCSASPRNKLLSLYSSSPCHGAGQQLPRYTCPCQDRRREQLSVSRAGSQSSPYSRFKSSSWIVPSIIIAVPGP